MFLKFRLEGFLEVALVQGLKVFKIKILIYWPSTEPWEHRTRRNYQAMNECLAITVQ